MAQQIIPDSEYNEQDFKEWEKYVTITRYEHDYVNKQRIIDYEVKPINP